MIRFEDTELLLHSFAHKVTRRLYAGGATSTQKEDVFQELVCAWCKARDSFDATQGVPFAAYLMLGMRRHINRWAQEKIDFALLAPVKLDKETGEEGNSSTIQEIIADERVIACDDAMIANERRARIKAKLSPRTRQMIEIIENPPREILEELNALQHRAAKAKSEGLHGPAPKSLTLNMLFEVFGMSRVEIAKTYKEIDRIGSSSSI